MGMGIVVNKPLKAVSAAGGADDRRGVQAAIRESADLGPAGHAALNRTGRDAAWHEQVEDLGADG
jgi:hypothetical protein